MRIRFYGWSLGILLTGIVSSCAQAQIVFGSFDASRTPRPFSGSAYSNIRADLANPANFGSAGLMPETVTFAPDIKKANTASLSGIDVFIVAEADSLSNAEVSALRNFVLSGNSLIITSDTLSFLGANKLVKALDGGKIGNPSGGAQRAKSGKIKGSGLATQGPFGALDFGVRFASTEAETLTPGSHTTILGANHKIAELGEIEPEALGPGAGSVLIATDVLFTNLLVPPATYAGNKNNAILFENFVARSRGAAVPEPSACALFAGLGAFGMGLLARRRRQVR